VAADGVRAANSASLIFTLIVRAGTLSSIKSPLRISASGPPAAASGETCKTTVPKAVPLIRPSQIRTRSSMPRSSNFFGIAIFETSGIPGYPLGPHPRRIKTLFSSTSRSGLSMRS